MILELPGELATLEIVGQLAILGIPEYLEFVTLNMSQCLMALWFLERLNMFKLRKVRNILKT